MKINLLGRLKAHAEKCKLQLCWIGRLPDLMGFMELVKPWLLRCYETGRGQTGKEGRQTGVLVTRHRFPAEISQFCQIMYQYNRFY